MLQLYHHKQYYDELKLRLLQNLIIFAVFKSGTEKGFRGLIPVGGHITPISIPGDKLLLKKAQKKEKKNKTSEIINKINPILSPDNVDLVCKP
jgi:hypothetical protein